ncbi:MAG: hypothetical protein N2319_11520 [Candidatus Kapabacteria bacterium]|nr:hypothetical protein [Candidatus Kapabacteria bacterium]
MANVRYSSDNSELSDEFPLIKHTCQGCCKYFFQIPVCTGMTREIVESHSCGCRILRSKTRFLPSQEKT